MSKKYIFIYAWISLWLILTSLQPGGLPQTVVIKNIGLSNESPAKFRLNLLENDEVLISFRNSKNEVLSKSGLTYTLTQIPASEIASGPADGKAKRIDIYDSGEYVLEISKTDRKDSYINVYIEKSKGKWSQGNPPVTIESALIAPPDKNNPNNGITMSWPVEKGGKFNLSGEGKNAKGLSMSLPQYKIENQTLDKGFSTEIPKDINVEVTFFLDEENLKAKGLKDKVISLFSKKGSININEFAAIKAQSTPAPKGGGTGSGDSPLNSKPGKDEKTGGTGPGSELEKLLQMQEDAAKRSEEMAKIQNEAMLAALMNLKPVEKIKLELATAGEFGTVELPCQFDYSKSKKRLCRSFPRVNSISGAYFGFWVGINKSLNDSYLNVEKRLSNANFQKYSPLQMYSNHMYFERGAPEWVYNLPAMQLPVPVEEKMVSDDVEIAILNEHNKELFEQDLPYESYINRTDGSTGQVYIFGKAAMTDGLYICACNKNKLSPITMHFKAETYTLNNE